MPKAKAGVKAKTKVKAQVKSIASPQAAAKKSTTKKVAAKKVSITRSASQKPSVKTDRKVVAIPEKQTKMQIIKNIAEETSLTTTQVKDVFECLQSLVSGHMKLRGSGEFTIPEVGVKVRRLRKKATKKRLGRNPFTGEEITIPPKPARDVIKVTAMKALKETIVN